MKKLCTILLLTIILTTSLLCVGVCFAADSNQFHYQAKKDVQLFEKEDLSGNSFFIPATYFVLIDKDRKFNEKSAAVTYLDKIFYINPKVEIDKKNLVKYDKALTNPFYTVDNLKVKDDLTKITVSVDGTDEFLLKEKITSISFLGFNTIAEKQYYYVKIVNTKYSGDIITNILASETNQSGLTLATTPQHPSAKAEEGNAPSIKNPDGTTPDASNALVRNILIGVICALSIVVVFLIFKPSKKNNKKYHNNQPPYDSRNNNNGNYPDNY